MIIEKISTFELEEKSSYSWTGLKRFKNQSLTARRIIELHNPTKGQKKNVEKQARQIRQCLMQAEEYFDASNIVLDAIRPLLLYYGAMSLALTEILLKSDGHSSLDASRGKHAHHGLELKISGDPSKVHDLFESASSLRAVPHVRCRGDRFGTFELWHRLSREYPFLGKRTTVLDNGMGQIGFTCVATPRKEKLPELDLSGVNLLWCFQHTPGLSGLLASHSITSMLVPGVISIYEDAISREVKYQQIIHPFRSDVLNQCLSKFTYDAKDFEAINITEMPSGFIVEQTISENSTANGRSMPMAFQNSSDRIYFCADNLSLTEFGIYYLGLYILGNYCRYYPDMWMNEVDTHSDLYMIACQFMNIAAERLPMLSCAEMSGEIRVKKIS